PPEGVRKPTDKDHPAQRAPERRYRLVPGAGGQEYYQIGDYYVCREEFPGGAFPEGAPRLDVDGKRKFTIHVRGEKREKEEKRTVYKFPNGKVVDCFDYDAAIKGRYVFVAGLDPESGVAERNPPCVQGRR